MKDAVAELSARWGEPVDTHALRGSIPGFILDVVDALQDENEELRQALYIAELDA